MSNVHPVKGMRMAKQLRERVESVKAGPTKIELSSLVEQQRASLLDLESKLKKKEEEIQSLSSARRVSGAAEVLGLREAISSEVDSEEAGNVVETARKIGESIIELMGSRDWATGERGCHHANKLTLIGALIVLRQTGLLALCGLRVPGNSIPETLRDFIGDRRKGAAQALASRSAVA